MIDESFVPKLAKKVRLRFDRHEGQHMLVYPERGLLLSESAAKIVGRCDGTRSLGAIADELAIAHGADRGVVLRDVRELVESLAGKGLLER